MARENASLSGLEAKPVRWIVDDEKFVQREVRRGHKYDAIVMDPPSRTRCKRRGGSLRTVFMSLSSCVQKFQSETTVLYLKQLYYWTFPGCYGIYS